MTKHQNEEQALYYKGKKILVFLVFIFSSVTNFMHSQTDTDLTNYLTSNLHKVSNQNISDLVYLQTSKDIYETQEDLWFKGYVLDSQYFIPSLRSKVLFVQLVNDRTNKAVWEEKYEIEDGFVDGHVYLQDTLQDGSYSLRAYSSHSYYRNTKAFYALRQLKIVKSILKKQSTVTSVKDSTGFFNCFAEGGDLVSGIQSKVAFKSTTAKGFPKKVVGTLYENDNPIVKFKSQHAGMGSFVFTPHVSNRYHIKLSSFKTDSVFTLPQIHKEGKTLKLLRTTKDKVLFKVSQSSHLPEEKVYLRLQIRGVVYNIVVGQLKKELLIAFPLDKLPQGIAEVTLFNKDLEPVAERLVYVNSNKKLYIQASLYKTAYETKEKATVNLKVTNEKGEPVIAHLGLSVYDHLYQNTAGSKTIESHYQLSSQIKGQIYNPSYYFNIENKNRTHALNLLLLTQGWRRYIWNEANLRGSYKTRKTQILSDTILGKAYARSLKDAKKKGGAELYVMAYSPEATVKDYLPVDSLGYFNVLPIQLKRNEKRFLYLKPLTPKKADYTIVLQKRPFELIEKQRANTENFYPLLQPLEKKKTPQDFLMSGYIEQLDAVFLSKKKTRVYRDKYIRTLDSLAKLEATRDYVCHDVMHKVSCGIAQEKGGPDNWLCRSDIHGVLNCPLILHDSGKNVTRPIEGELYYTFSRLKPDGFVARYVFRNANNLTESEILRWFNFALLKGFYGKREFYEQVYDEETTDNSFADYRNTLFWKPDIITNEQGEATIEFFCSDINTKFIGNVEGVGGFGLLGSENFEFMVRKVE